MLGSEVLGEVGRCAIRLSHAPSLGRLARKAPGRGAWAGNVQSQLPHRTATAGCDRRNVRGTGEKRPCGYRTETEGCATRPNAIRYNRFFRSIIRKIWQGHTESKRVVGEERAGVVPERAHLNGFLNGRGEGNGGKIGAHLPAFPG